MDEIISIIVSLGKFCLLGKTDIENAFRIIPVAPEDYWLLGFKWKDKFYYEKSIPMGCSVSCKTFEKFATAFQWVLHRRGFPFVRHVIDDYIFMGKSGSDMCQRSMTSFLEIAQQINCPIKHSKTVSATTRLQVLGIVLDSVEMSASLPQEKVIEIIDKIEAYVKRKCITLQNLQSIIGSLNWACSVVVPGRAFLRRLIDLTLGMTNPSHHINLTNGVRADLRLWLMYLKNFNGRIFFLHQNWVSAYSLPWIWHITQDDLCVCFMGNNWISFRIPPLGGASDGSLSHLFVVYISLKIMATQWQNKCLLLLHPDMVLVNCIKNSTHKNKSYMHIIREIVLLCLKNNIYLSSKNTNPNTQLQNSHLAVFQSHLNKILGVNTRKKLVVPKGLLTFKM